MEWGTDRIPEFPGYIGKRKDCPEGLAFPNSPGRRETLRPADRA